MACDLQKQSIISGTKVGWHLPHFVHFTCESNPKFSTYPQVGFARTHTTIEPPKRQKRNGALMDSPQHGDERSVPPLSSYNAWLTLYKHPGGVASNTACKIHMAHCAPIHWLRLKCHQTFCAKVIALVSSLPDYSHYPLLHRHLSNIKENHIGNKKK